ncbi:MAG: peroxiredoxin-like family protein [Geminicoccaceae bacterium]
MSADLTPLFPRQPVPPLDVPLIGGGVFRVAQEAPENFTLVVFYRGLHCPICRGQLRDLDAKLGDFAARGVSVVAVSCDDESRATETKTGWGLERLRIGYGLALPTARRWGLYISSGHGRTSTGVEEPARFSEPGLFLIRPDSMLYFGSVQTMPFARPHFADILAALDYILKNDYPARGEIIDLTASA